MLTKLPVESFDLNQFRMAAKLHQPSVFEHCDAVGVAYGR